MILKVEELKEGMVIRNPVFTNQGVVLIEKGTILTQRKIDKLAALKIEFVEVDSSEAEKVINSETIEETVNAKKRSETAESLITFLSEPNDLNIQNMKTNTKEIVETINNDDKFNYDLESYINQKDIHAHSVRVACFSIVLAKIYNNKLKRNYPNILQKDLIDLEDIAIAALLHDIGVICKDSKKLNEIKEIPTLEKVAKWFPGIKDTPLDRYDGRYSSVYSYCLLGNTHQINDNSKCMILLSNEPESEKGCLRVPHEVHSQKHPSIMGGKIIRTCDIYDKVMSKTIEQGSSLEEVASAIGYYAENNIISNEIEQLLINNLPLYPIGTKVKLSNGKSAIVKESFVGPYKSYKPVVETFDGRITDLSKTTIITVKSIMNKQELCKNMLNYQLREAGKYDKSINYQLD